MIFKDRTGTNLNRKKITIISQTPTEIIADIERADNPIEEGTTINASVFTAFQENINSANATANSALETANSALSDSAIAKSNSTNALSVANQAKTDVTNATNAANEATTAANNVINTANQALEIANSSQQTSNSALDSATDALDNSSEALTTSQNALNTANTAQTLANSTSSKVDNLDTSFETFKSTFWQTIYPIGSIYMSINSTSPSTLFGGTWVQLTDRVLIGAGGSYSVNSTGGSTNHTHTLNNGYAKVLYTWINDNNRLVLETKENVSYSTNFRGGGMSSYDWSTNTVASGTALGGSTDSTSNMPPYLAVYMWKRTV